MAKRRAVRATPSGAPKVRTASGESRALLVIAFVIYAAATLYVGLHHEPWRDEADPWLLIRDGGITTMLTRAGYAGMPPLWYLLITPLVKLGLPYLSMALLHVAIACIAAAVFLWLAPLPKLLRVLFVFSYFMAYEYAVVARPYAPAILFLFAAMACWKDRDQRPVLLSIFVALAALTTTHTLFFAAVLGAIFLFETVRERRLREPRRWAAIAIMLGAGLLSAFLVRPPADAPPAHVIRGVVAENFVWTLGNAFFPDLPLWVGFLIGAGVLVLVTLTIGRRYAAQAFLWSSTVFLALLYTFVWAAGLRHAGLFTVVVVAALWMAAAYPQTEDNSRWRKITFVVLGLSFAYSAATCIAYWRRDVIAPFSSAAEMGRFITSHGLQQYPIAAHPPAQAEAVLPYTGTRFYYPGMFDDGSFMLWNTQYNIAGHTPYAAAVAEAQQHFQGRSWLLLVNQPMRRAEDAGFRLVYATKGMPFEHRDEVYWLYAPLDWSGPPLPEPQ